MSFVLVLAAGLLPSAVPARAQVAAGETIGQLSRSAGEQLERSILDLNQLRDGIATEKLPMAKELTAAEEKLSKLRKEHDKVTRLVDEGNLGISTLKASMKARQDELSYIGNLLDEYARTFETRVNPSELQYSGAAVESAKDAAENTSLSMAEKYTRQTDLVGVSMKRLFDSVGGMRFRGSGVDQQGSVVDGQFAIIGPVALFAASTGVAGLVVQQSGSDKPLIRPLDEPLQAGIAPLVERGEGMLPLDPSRGGALKALVQKTNLIHVFEKGGPIMWPLLVASILALGTVLERFLFLYQERRRRDPKALEGLFAEVERGDTASAVRISSQSRDFVVRALGYALGHQSHSLPNALLYAQAQELKRFQRGLSILDTIITLAPLLGLLGTVTGMMSSFSLIGGELSAPGAITGGIAEALIATAFGLGIAITSLLPFNMLNTKLEEARHEIESAATQLELLVHAQPGAASVPGPGAFRAPIVAAHAPAGPHGSTGPDIGDSHGSGRSLVGAGRD